MAEPHDGDKLQPMSDAAIETPPVETEFQPAAPLKPAATEFPTDTADEQTQAPRAEETEASPAEQMEASPTEQGQASGAQGSESPGGLAGARQTLVESTATLRGQAGDKARDYAEQGKARATDALGQLSQMLTDAAGQVDEKLGEQYGQYARTAADRVQSFSSAIESKDVDDLIGDARALVRKSPAVAVGAAAAVGFVVARLLTAGIDQRDA